MDRTAFAKTYGGKADALFNITITFVNPEQWARVANFKETFMPYYSELFQNCVFEAHKYLIRITPIQTGRLRAGWTGILNKYNQDYTMAFMDCSLLHIPAGTGKPLDQAAIVEGMAMSEYIDEEYDKTIINSVPYGSYVEFGTSKMEGQYFTNKAMYKGELIIKNAFDAWFNKCSDASDIVEPDPIEQVVA